MTNGIPKLSGALNARLSVMMFLQYAIWGAWLPILFPFLGFRGFDALQSVMIFGAGAVGAIIGPLIAGQVADRISPRRNSLPSVTSSGRRWSGSWRT